jgi:hypothetical protein
MRNLVLAVLTGDILIKTLNHHDGVGGAELPAPEFGEIVTPRL